MMVRNLSPSRLKKLTTTLFLPDRSLLIRAVFNSSQHVILDPSPTSNFAQNPVKTDPFFFSSKPFSSQSEKSQSSSGLSLIRDGNYDESTSQMLLICPGCGVTMQDFDSKQPGFFIKPSLKGPTYKKYKKMNPIDDVSEISDSLKKGSLIDILDIGKPSDMEFLGSTEKNVSEKPVVCARCHSLRYHGKVKDPSVENLLPDFDFDHTVGRRLMLVSGARTVVIIVVDVLDFDGSFPRKVASLISRTIDENDRSWKEGKPGNVPRLVLVVTKIDLLPSSISPTRLEHWIRTRARESGAVKLSSVHMVSAVKDWGIKNLLDDVVTLVGPRGNTWVVGSQNAGKSTLINAIGKCVGGEATYLTEAPVPGTTLGIIRVEGVLPGKAKLFDTPGLLNPHQISSRLNDAEHKLINIKKELTPRTYRIKAGHSIHIGGLVRLDIVESSASSIYVTVWASPLLPLHMGKTENACLLLEKHFGHQLQPPIGEDSVEKLGKWVRKEFQVCGTWWDSSSIDIAVAGLGWFAIGLKGETQLAVWTYEGVDLTLRNALLPQRSNNFEVTGFTVSDIISKADAASSMKQQKERNRKDINLASSVPPLIVNTT